MMSGASWMMVQGVGIIPDSEVWVRSDGRSQSHGELYGYRHRSMDHIVKVPYETIVHQLNYKTVPFLSS
jgi:hypothetical protein